MTSVTHINSKMNQPQNYQEMGFFPSLYIYKNLPRITVFRKLKCPDPSMIPLPAEVKECLQKSIRLTSYTPFNQLICCISVSSYMLTRRFAVHLNRSLVGLLGIVIEKTDVAYLRSFPYVVVKKTFQVTCGDPETEVDLILSRAGIFETPKDIDDFTMNELPVIESLCLRTDFWDRHRANIATH